MACKTVFVVIVSLTYHVQCSPCDSLVSSEGDCLNNQEHCGGTECGVVSCDQGLDQASVQNYAGSSVNDQVANIDRRDVTAGSCDSDLQSANQDRGVQACSTNEFNKLFEMLRAGGLLKRSRGTRFEQTDCESNDVLFKMKKDKKSITKCEDFENFCLDKNINSVGAARTGVCANANSNYDRSNFIDSSVGRQGVISNNVAACSDSSDCSESANHLGYLAADIREASSLNQGDICSQRGIAHHGEICKQRGIVNQEECCNQRGTAHHEEICNQRGIVNQGECCNQRGTAHHEEICNQRGIVSQEACCNQRGIVNQGECCNQRGVAHHGEICNQRGLLNQCEICSHREIVNQGEICNQREIVNQEDIGNQREIEKQGEICDQREIVNQGDMCNKREIEKQGEICNQREIEKQGEICNQGDSCHQEGLENEDDCLFRYVD